MKYVPVFLPEEVVKRLSEQNFASILTYYGDVMPAPLKHRMVDLNIMHYGCKQALTEPAPAEEPAGRAWPWAYIILLLITVATLAAAAHWRSVGMECLYPDQPGRIERVVP